MRRPGFCRCVLIGLVAVIAPRAHAQFAVIDVAAVTQLVSQLQTLEKQVATARSQLTQAQQEFQAITGGRGMQLLLSGTVRNYLPGDWAALQAAAQGTNSSFSAFTADVRGAVSGLAVLPPGRLASLPPAVSAQVQAARQTAAALLATNELGLANASSRFAAIQQLIDAIAGAEDAKAALDLQARISAEIGMLQNEQTKLQVMNQALQAQGSANTQRLRELAIAGHGGFATRFQPLP